MNSNTLEFFIKMKDMMSGGLASMAKNAKSSFGEIQKAVTNVQTNIDNTRKKNDILSASFDTLKTRARQLEEVISKSTSLTAIKNARREFNALQRDMSTHAGGDRGGGFSFASMAGIAGLALSASSVFAGVKDSLMQSAMAENQKIAFKVMLGNKQDGEALYGSIRKMADTTPFQSQDLMRSGKMLLGFGENKQRIMPDLKMLGDVAAAQDDPTQALAGLSHAYGEAVASGRLLGRNTLELINWGFNPLKEISIMTGKSMADLKKEEEAGAISADMLRAAFAHATGEGGRFNNMMEQRAQTLSGKWTTFMDMTNGVLRNLGDSLSPLAKGLMDATTSLLAPQLLAKSALGAFREQSEHIRLLQIQLTGINTTEAERKKILDELTSINPNITDGISAQAIEYAKLAGNINKVIDALYNKKLADEFAQKNAGTLTSFEQAQESQRDTFMEMQKIESKYNLPYLTDPNISTGKKQVMFQKYLMQHKKGSAMSGNLNEEDSDLSMYQYYLKTGNEAVTTINKLTPVIAKQQAQQSKMLDSYHKYFGGGTDSLHSNVPKDNKTSNDEDATENAARGVASGGARNITINIGKFMDKTEFHIDKNHSIDDSVGELENKLKDMFMRVLYSGAKMQA